ncbi:NAD(P)H-hydrate epimerase [Candidatus Woesearchaeota archaeon]|nr:NAD(P)H-hydrate epimerase [Candidatus Woesearchaeota archaeon]
MIPYVNQKQISKLDKLMVEQFNIPVVIVMESAGYRLAEFARKQFPREKNILICCGKGNNGGDGIAAARHLLNFGYKPKIFLITKDVKNEPKTHLDIARKLKISIITTLKKLENELEKTNIVYDCLIGYNLKGNPKGDFKEAINLINKSKKKIVACDIPSGIDADKGVISENYIKASHILFLSLPKIGCKELKAKKFVADIGVPKALYPKIKIKAKNYFQKKSIIKI